ncbi:MAG: hypothetical protein U0797_16540 [Gemmataceae bacterium]
MNCADVRQRLLLSERPDKPGPEESRHLAGCSSCHAWLRRLVRLERRITELHVPSSPVPAGLLEQIAGSDEVPLVRSPLRPSAKTRSVREVGRQKLALAIALAATLAMFTLAWWLWPPMTTPAALAPWRDGMDRQVAAATTTPGRVEVMAEVANQLLDVAQERGDNPGQVALAAEDFEKRVGDLVVAARAMSPGDLAHHLPRVLDRLKQAGTRAEGLARQWEARRPEAARSMRQIVESARKAEERLRELARG